ncbi:MAG: hypothetical protein AABX08_00885 [Nanoarchaeota archaeon]
MKNCPNCNYELVLLSNRQKYKCALCSKLYSRKYIENREFRIWNKKQRELDIQNLKASIKPKPRFRGESARRWQEKNKDRINILASKWRDANRDRYTDQKREYYNRNLEHVNSKQRENYAKNREKITVRKERWSEKNPYSYKLKKRLADLRYQQKLLALKIIKNNELKPSPTHSEEVLPTFLHSYLLTL